MGIYQSKDNEALKRSNVKLQAQSITGFDGSAIKWHTWKKKTRAAIGTAGLLKILDDEDYANRNSVDNETIFHLLQVATSDGNAAHLVDKYEETSDGRMAYQEMLRWYEGDELTTETAEDIRSKIDKTLLTSSTSASEYINNFLQYTKLLDDLGEAYTPSKTISIFLDQIRDPDYSNTKESCIEDKLSLDQCIERIRSKERRIGRSKINNRRGISVRRDQLKENGAIDNNGNRELDIGDYKNEKGFYSIPREIWRKLSLEDQQMIKKINGELRRKRERESPRYSEGDKAFKSVNARRNATDDSSNKKPRTLEIRDRVTEDKEKPQEEIFREEESEGAITTRRDLIRFRMSE